MAKGIDRTRRIGGEIRRVLAQAAGEILDHRHATILSFIEVRVSRDLAHAKVYVTYLFDDPQERETLVAALNAHRGRFRHHLARHLSTRIVPELRFYHDQSRENGARIETLLATLPGDRRADEKTTER